MSERETPTKIESIPEVHLDPWLIAHASVGEPLGPSIDVLASTVILEAQFPAIVELESTHAYDLDCRSLGARDLFDLFQIEKEGQLLAERIRLEMPDHASMAIHKFFTETPSEGLDFPIPQNVREWVSNETLWEKVMDFFRGYVITDILSTRYYVPVFCVRPAQHDGGKCKVEYSQANSEGFEFTIGIPGLLGGHGLVRTSGYDIETGEFNVPWQLQAEVNALVIERTSEALHKKLTMVPIDVASLGDADFGDSDFINYDISTKNQLIPPPFVKRSATGSWHTKTIEKRSFDKFDFSVNIHGFGEFRYVVESTSNEKFRIKYYAVPRHKYELRGLSEKCHDIFVFHEAIS